jgi:predicted TIM-barrel fold metal-dependent hydrolase
MRSGATSIRNGGSGNDIKTPDTNPFRIINVILVILIIISAATLIYISIDVSDSGDKVYDTSLTVKSIIPPREAGIINGHDHIQKFEEGAKWTAAMDRVGVSTTIMVGSPDATFWMNPSGPFNKYKDNNEELFELVDEYPDKFIAFPTIYTYDDYKLELLKSYIRRGALGVKLFNGHWAVFYEHLGPLNVSTMYPVYEYCERERVPIIWHVHLGIEQLQNEFEEIMVAFPNLIVNIPHFMLSSINLWQTNGYGRLRYYLETYPNLYTDVSWGYWVKDGLWRLSNHTEVYREFIIEFQDRFTFGTDMVSTIHPRKTVEWIANMTQGYIDILEKKNFNLTVKGDIEDDFNGDSPGTHNGLHLPKSVVDKIYYDNMIKFLNYRLYYEKLSDVINDSKLTFGKAGSGGRGGVNDSTSTSATDLIRLSGETLMAIDHDIKPFK